MSGLFETNDLSQIQTYTVLDSVIYVMDDFYKNPHAIRDLILSNFPPLWKPCRGSRNGEDYFDRRNNLRVEGLPVLMERIGRIINRRVDDHKFVTNLTKFVDRQFNDYEHKYWWPHRDSGYNGIVYLNDELPEYSGTNLYHPDGNEATTEEGLEPWSDKNQWELVHSIRGRFNRFVCFDGQKFPHAMCIDDDTFFGDFYRINQVLFFKPPFSVGEMRASLRRLVRHPRRSARQLTTAFKRKR